MTDKEIIIEEKIDNEKEDDTITEVSNSQTEDDVDNITEESTNQNEDIIETNSEVSTNKTLEDEETTTEVKEEESLVEEPKEEIKRIEVSPPGNDEAIVEGLLFIVGEDGARKEQIALALGKSIEDIEVILENIQHKYASELYGIELVGYGSVYKFVSKKDIYPYAQELFHLSKPNTLSQSALETLAIIAYKQPITRVEIEELRGVGADMMLRKLLARNLIKEAGRSEAPGRPILYEVTDEFMDSFKLYTLKELPDLPEYNKEESSDLFDRGEKDER